MRKIITGFVFVLFFGINTDAQIQKNTILYEKGKICLSSSPFGGFGSSSYMLGLNIKPGYFIANNLLIATEFGGTLSNEITQRDIYVKPSIEYFVLNRKITPVIRAGYIFRKQINDNSFYSSPFAGAGVHFSFGKNNRFGINAGVDYYFKNDRLLNGFMPYVSFGYYFGRKKVKKKVLY